MYVILIYVNKNESSQNREPTVTSDSLQNWTIQQSTRFILMVNYDMINLEKKILNAVV